MKSLRLHLGLTSDSFLSQKESLKAPVGSEKGELNPGEALFSPVCVGGEIVDVVGGVGGLQMLWYRRGQVSGGSGLAVWDQCRNVHSMLAGLCMLLSISVIFLSNTDFVHMNIFYPLVLCSPHVHKSHIVSFLELFQGVVIVVIFAFEQSVLPRSILSIFVILWCVGTSICRVVNVQCSSIHHCGFEIVEATKYCNTPFTTRSAPQLTRWDALS